MGVYLPNVDMPKDDEVLTIRICSDGSIWQQYRGTVPNAKAISVPAHARLIDADALYEDCALDRNYEVMATTTRINEYMQLKIDGAPTIIETGDESLRGKWIRNERGNYVCSNCKCEREAVFGLFFCPNCGANMDA